MSSVHHKIILKRKTSEDDIAPTCYCGLDRREQFMFTCLKCQRAVHIGCLKSKRPSPLLGDIYFKFTCEVCSPQFEESFERISLPWTYVLILSLYNLHVQGSSNCGYFKWKTQICYFIEKHWHVFFDPSRKKSNTWPGTVAGTLSSNSPQLFKNGAVELQQPGWWALASHTLPSVEELVEAGQRRSKPSGRNKPREVALLSAVDETLCLRNRPSKSSIQAAIELKEKRSHLTEAKEIRQSILLSSLERRKHGATDSSRCFKSEVEGPSTSHQPTNDSVPKYVDFSLLHNYIKEEPEEPMELDDQNYVKSELTEEVVEEEFVVSDFLEHCQNLPNLNDFEDTVLQNDEDILDMQSVALSIDVDTESCHFLQEQTLDTSDLLSFNVQGLENENTTEIVDNLSDSEVSSSSDSFQNLSESHKTKQRRVKLNLCEPEEMKYTLMTEYDEQQLLKRLEKLSSAVETNFAAKRLRRKLLVRQKQREQNQPLFNLDEQFQNLCGLTIPDAGISNRTRVDSTCPLDRYQYVCGSIQGRVHTSFVTRLMGFSDDQLDSVISPYTLRTLKPFIFRDYESVPLKLKLLNEIQHYHKSKDPSWEAPKCYPLDFCYVRPHHIPVINNLCQEFFWPGIELSECLEYPDFSCVVLYRKVIVGFAFMIPDVKYNEVYISFIFTHPEWRNAGIATFMIYHLIQTCMGKDVTLHVSVTNPAVFLYQKFGFKVEEMILDFYDKYLPVQSKECRHALFMRLSR